MAFPPFNDPSQFVTFDGPNGPVAIPNNVASSFQLPPPPPPAPGPLPTFDPAELAPPPPMPPDPAGPVPSAFAPPPPPQQPQFVNPDEAAALPAMPAPRPQRQAPLPPAPPPSPLDDRNAALAVEADAIRQRGDAIGAAANEEARLYGEADKRAAAMETVRAAEREKEIRERDRARADVNAATDRYVNYKVDENRRWNDLSTGRKILAGIAVALSGLGNALANKGSAPNGALEMIKGAIQDDLRLQMDERDQLGKNVGQKKDTFADLRQTLSDNESVYKAAVAGEYERAANQIRTAAASSKGDIAKSESEIAVSHLMGEAGKLRQEAADTDYSRKMAEKNYGLAAAGQSLQKQRFEREAFESDRGHALRVKELEAAAEAARAAGNMKAAEVADKKAKEERELGVGTGYSKESVGLAPSPASAERIRPMVAAGANAARLIDGIKRVRAESGSEWFKTSEARQLKADMGALIVSVKNTAGLGALAGPDMELIEKYVGTTDATETDALNSMVDGLDRARTNLIGQVRSELSAAQVEGADRWDPPDLSRPPKSKKDEKLVATMKTAPGQSPGLINRLTPYHEAQVKLYGGADTEGGKSYIRRIQGGYDVKQETMVNQLARGAASGATPEQRSLMLGQLRQVATNESTPPGLRALAAEKLKAIEGAAK